MSSILFFTTDNPNKPFFQKHMEAPPRKGEHIYVLTDPSDNTRYALFEVVDVVTITHMYVSDIPEGKKVVIKMVDDLGEVAT